MDFAPLARIQAYRVTKKYHCNEITVAFWINFLATSFSNHYQIDKWKYSTYAMHTRPLA